MFFRKATFILLLTVSSAQATLPLGAPVAQIVGLTDTREVLSLEKLPSIGYTFIYFFPRVGSRDWREQSLSLLEALPKLNAAGVAKIIGVSSNSPEELALFKEKLRLPFDFVSSPDALWSRSFHVPIQGVFMERTSFIIEKGKILAIERQPPTEGQGDHLLAQLATLKTQVLP